MFLTENSNCHFLGTLGLTLRMDVRQAADSADAHNQWLSRLFRINHFLASRHDESFKSFHMGGELNFFSFTKIDEDVNFFS